MNPDKIFKSGANGIYKLGHAAKTDKYNTLLVCRHGSDNVQGLQFN